MNIFFQLEESLTLHCINVFIKEVIAHRMQANNKNQETDLGGLL